MADQIAVTAPETVEQTAPVETSPLHNLAADIRRRNPNTYEQWAGEFSSATVVRISEEAARSGRNYGRATLQDASGTEFYAGSNSLLDLAERNGLALDKCSFSRTFSSSDLASAQFTCELKA
jgi:hypothetical protein